MDSSTSLMRNHGNGCSDRNQDYEAVYRVGMLLTPTTSSDSALDVSSVETESTMQTRARRRRWIALVLLAFSNFCTGCCISLQAPFFPKEAEKKGATPTEYGFIFGVFELTVFVAAPVMGKLISIYEPRFILNSGMFSCGVTTICFGLLDFVSHRSKFVGFAFLVRILEGIGAAALQTGSFVLIASEFTDSVATTFAVLEVFIGIGLIIGPTLGGTLYDIGGYGLPFYVMGGLIIIASFLMIAFLPDSDRQHRQQGNWLKFWLHPITFVYAITVFSTFNYIGYNQATLEPHLRPFKLIGFHLGLIFTLCGAMYAISAPFWGWLSDTKLEAKVICIIGCLIAMLSLLLLGPMPFLQLDSGLWNVITALAVEGASVGAKLVCGFSGSLKDTFSRGFPADITTYGLVSSMFTSAQSLGAFVGPSLGGYLLETVGYDYGTFVLMMFEIVVLSLLILYAASSRFLHHHQNSEKESIVTASYQSTYG